MESLELLEKINKKMIDAQKRKSICYENVSEIDKLKGDMEHELYHHFGDLSAKQKRERNDEYVKVLKQRHEEKYEYEELEILEELYTTPQMKQAMDKAISKLRKLDQELEQPIYYYRSKKKREEEGEILGNK